VYYPQAFEVIQDFFINNPHIDIVYGDANHIDVDDRILEAYYTESWSLERLKEICYICQPAVFFRRNVVEKFGLLNEELQYCMDYEYWLRLAKNGAKFAHLNQVLAGSRLHSDTKTLGSRVQVHKEINDMLKYHFTKVPDRWLSNYAHALVETKFEHKNLPSWRLRRSIAMQTLLSGLRWNKSISKPLLVATLNWLAISFEESAGLKK
jgi:GT2 family glycosyltransferase